jgi:hypothetical protein
MAALGPNFESWHKGRSVLQIGDARQFDYWYRNVPVIQTEQVVPAADIRHRPNPIFND